VLLPKLSMARRPPSHHGINTPTNLDSLIDDFASLPMATRLLCVLMVVLIAVLVWCTMRESLTPIRAIKNWWLYRDLPPLERVGEDGSGVAVEQGKEGNESGSEADEDENTPDRPTERRDTGFSLDETVDFDVKTGQVVVRKKSDLVLKAIAKPSPESTAAGTTAIVPTSVPSSGTTMTNATGVSVPAKSNKAVQRAVFGSNTRAGAAPIRVLRDEDAARVAANGGTLPGGILVR
jgi:hypothetical protein